MNVTGFPDFYNIRQRQARPVDQLVSMLNDKAEAQSPLEAAKQALLDAKAKLDEHRNEQIENALGGYRALRSRQTSYESGLEVQQKQSEDFRALSSRRDELTDELSAAKADYEAYTATEAAPDITWHHKQALRVSSLENELSSVSHDISALVEQANRYTRSQRQYADYLKNTDQGGYAAYEYQDLPEYTEENFATQTAGMIDRMEAGAKQWRERVSSYCEEYGLTPCDFESWLQERHKLADACFAAQQRVLELQYAEEGAAAGESVKTEFKQSGVTPGKDHFDTVEISGAARGRIRRGTFG